MTLGLAGGLATLGSGVVSIITFLIVLVKPIREKFLGTKEAREGQKALLRADMLRTYYHHNEHDSIRQYEYENFILEYKAYKALGGNSFIDKIYDEVKTWDITT